MAAFCLQSLPLSQPTSCSHQPSTAKPTSKILSIPSQKTPPGKTLFHFSPQIYSHPCGLLLELCSDMKELLQFLTLTFKSDLYSETHFRTKLLSLFSRYNNMRYADVVFRSFDRKPDDVWYTMLKGYSNSSCLDSAFGFFARMCGVGVAPVVYSFTYLLKNCGERLDIGRGRQLHAQLIQREFEGNVFAMTALMNMYSKCGQLQDAHQLFVRMTQKDVAVWNALVAGYAQNGRPLKALEMVRLMQTEGMALDSITLISILPACANLGCFEIGKSVHAYAYRAGFESLVTVATAILDVYAKCRRVDMARLVFDRMPARNVVSWNALIDGYARSGNSEEAMRLFRHMQREGLHPTDVTYMAALHACANMTDLEQGKYVHGLVIDNGLNTDVSVCNSLITMYSKCKRVDIAADIFRKMKLKTLVSWNAMISGYTQNGKVKEAVDLFVEMHRKKLKPDTFTTVSIIPAYANMSVVRLSKWVHGYVMRMNFHKNVYVMTALIDMYAKCGSVMIARRLFDMMTERHVITWNAMIDGYGTHGLGKDAVSLFYEMQRSATVSPNDITFLNVLSACSHAGLVDQGRKLFTSMTCDYNIIPAIDHYATMVDLLGRAGFLKEAWDFIQEMPIEPSISVFGAMLGACKIHQNVELAEKTAEKLFELDPREGGYYVLLANIYETASMWEDVSRVRSMMGKKGLQKVPGCSQIELKSEIHTFYSGSTDHPQTEMTYKKLADLITDIKAAGYVPDTNSLHDVEDDIKEKLLNTHSEKLAIAFGLINTTPGTTIQIRKNLRVCGDCHNATKFISKVTKREIIVRDMHRFHHFKDGTCSCGDYW